MFHKLRRRLITAKALAGLNALYWRNHPSCFICQVFQKVHWLISDSLGCIIWISCDSNAAALTTSNWDFVIVKSTLIGKKKKVLQIWVHRHYSFLRFDVPENGPVPLAPHISHCRLFVLPPSTATTSVTSLWPTQNLPSVVKRNQWYRIRPLLLCSW